MSTQSNPKPLEVSVADTPDTEPRDSDSTNPASAPVATSVGQPSRDKAMKAAKEPVGTGASPLLAQLLALALIALGVVGVQEALVRTGIISSPSWTTTTVDAFNGLTRTAFWILVAGVAAVLVGAALLLVVFKRRPRKTMALKANTGVYIRTRDLTKVVETVLDGTDTVTDVHAKASRRQLNVEAVTVGPKSANNKVTDAIKARIEPVLAALDRAPKLKIKIRNEGVGGNDTAEDS